MDLCHPKDCLTFTHSFIANALRAGYWTNFFSKVTLIEGFSNILVKYYFY